MGAGVPDLGWRDPEEKAFRVGLLLLLLLRGAAGGVLRVGVRRGRRCWRILLFQLALDRFSRSTTRTS
jgi:hypothetical protein